MALLTFLFLYMLCTLPSLTYACKPTSKLTFKDTTLSNPYICLTISPDDGSITQLSSCIDAKCPKTPANLLAQAIKLKSTDSAFKPSKPDITMAQTSPNTISLTIKNTLSSPETTIEDIVTIALSSTSRSFNVSTFTYPPKGSYVPLTRAFPFTSSSITALYEGGPTQMKGGDDNTKNFYSEEKLTRIYSLGAPGGDVSSTTPSRAFNGSVDIIFTETAGIKGTLIQSNIDGVESGFQVVYAGTFNNTHDKWVPLSALTAPAPQSSPAAKPPALLTSFQLAPLNRDFPALSIPSTYSPSTHLPLSDMHGFLTGIYASPVGCLCTHKNCVVDGKTVGQIGTTINRPGRGYEGNYNFFDPDNYISTAAMLYSMDPYLQAEVLKVLIHNGAAMLTTGQLPHHFVADQPQYQALSGEIQTGPNVFWVLSCFNYAKTTGDVAWLTSYMPTLRKATNFLYSLFKDDTKKLALVPGSLMVDVFLRSNFTSDTNAMLIGFFREFADAELAVGNTTGSAALQTLADDVTADLNKYLWDGTDHFITQLNGDGSTRDFVDYDSNLIALAHNAVAADKATAVLKRIDAGQCRKGVTFVSEVYYGPDDTTDGNVGDSWCAMGRHAWFDSLARLNYGAKEDFDDLIFTPLQTHLIQSTFMHERLDCEGLQQQNRTEMYFEYPSIVAMITKRIRYGISLGLESVTVDPKFAGGDFIWNFGSLHVEWSSDKMMVTIPRGLKEKGETAAPLRKTGVRIGGLVEKDVYRIGNTCESEEKGVKNNGDVVTVGADGFVAFDSVMGLPCRLEVIKV